MRLLERKSIIFYLYNVKKLICRLFLSDSELSLGFRLKLGFEKKNANKNCFPNKKLYQIKGFYDLQTQSD